MRHPIDEEHDGAAFFIIVIAIIVLVAIAVC